MHVIEFSTLFCGPQVLRKESKILKQVADRFGTFSHFTKHISSKIWKKGAHVADLLHAIYQTCTNHTTYHK